MSAALQALDPPATDAAAFLLRVDALLPSIRERAAEVEQQGMISREVIGWLTEADVFRAMQPRQWGGLELDIATFFEGMVRIASACGSTGWVASVVFSASRSLRTALMLAVHAFAECGAMRGGQ